MAPTERQKSHPPPLHLVKVRAKTDHIAAATRNRPPRSNSVTSPPEPNMADDLTQAITDAAQEPLTVTVGPRTATAHSIPEMIAADQYAKAQDAIAGTNDQGGSISGWGSALRPARVVPPGAH
jgi:hypothetical protein